MCGVYRTIWGNRYVGIARPSNWGQFKVIARQSCTNSYQKEAEEIFYNLQDVQSCVRCVIHGNAHLELVSLQIGDLTMPSTQSILNCP